MAAYTLPREAFNLLVEALGERQKAEIFAKAMESAIDAIQQQAKEEILEKKNIAKIELKDELTKELVTRELFEERFNAIDGQFHAVNERFNAMNERFNAVNERFNAVDEKFKSLNFKMNLFIAIALIALTFANPTFVALIEKLF
jgi:hypothetical protein